MNHDLAAAGNPGALLCRHRFFPKTANPIMPIIYDRIPEQIEDLFFARKTIVKSNNPV
jgi:hypothetical protein